MYKLSNETKILLKNQMIIMNFLLNMHTSPVVTDESVRNAYFDLKHRLNEIHTRIGRDRCGVHPHYEDLT